MSADVKVCASCEHAAVLCASCAHNRRLIDELNAKLAQELSVGPAEAAQARACAHCIGALESLKHNQRVRVLNAVQAYFDITPPSPRPQHLGKLR